jgi:hypothetical protein
MANARVRKCHPDPYRLEHPLQSGKKLAFNHALNSFRCHDIHWHPGSLDVHGKPAVQALADFIYYVFFLMLIKRRRQAGRHWNNLLGGGNLLRRFSSRLGAFWGGRGAVSGPVLFITLISWLIGLPVVSFFAFCLLCF